MKKIFTKEFQIGLSVIVAIAIFVFGVDYLKGKNIFNPGNYYYADYEDVSGLAEAAPVVIDGYKIGQVREISFNYDHPGKIRVMLSLDKQLRLPQDSYAKIESSLLSGGYVRLVLGKSHTMIPVGGDVATRKSVDMMASLSQDVMPTVNSILPKVDTLLSNLNRLVENPALSTSISRLDGITASLYASSLSLQRTMNHDVPHLMGNVNRATNGLDTIVGNLGVLSAQLKQLPLNATVENVNTLVNSLTQLSNQLNDRNSTLGRLSTDPELYNRMNRIAADVDSLVVDIKKNPKRYVTIKVF